MSEILFWVPLDAAGRLATMPRPEGGDLLVDEVRHFRNLGVTHVVSLLEAHEVRQLRLLAVHCRAGIGPATLLAAAILHGAGIAAGPAFERIREARGRIVPDTPEQREWFEREASARRPAEHLPTSG